MLVLLLVFILLSLLLSSPIDGFEENSKFCIQTSEWYEDKQHDNKEHFLQQVNNVTHSKCEITVNLLTVKEKENFFNIICNGKEDQENLLQEFYYYFQYRNGYLNGRRTHFQLCVNRNSTLLAWMPYQELQHYYAIELDPKENVNYIAKATDKEHKKSNYCHFRHSDLVSHVSENLFTCVVIIREDDFYDLHDEINVLIEILPLMYEIRNVSYTPWINTTASYKSLLGKVFLKNRNHQPKNIFGSLGYVFEERIQLNLSNFYSMKKDVDKLPLLLEHKNVVLQLNEHGEGSIDVKDKVFFGRKLERRTQIAVSVIGQWFEHCQQFDADIYDYYGFGIRRFDQELHHGEIIFTRIDNAEPVYEIPQAYEPHYNKVNHTGSKHLARIKAKDGPNEREHRRTHLHDSNDDLIEDFETNSVLTNDTSQNIDKYYPWLVLSLLSIGLIVLFVIIIVTHVFNGNPRARERYKFSGLQKVSHAVNN